MSAARWAMLVAASLAAFVVGGVVVGLLVLAFGQSLLGWHDNIGPEVRWAVIGGLLAAMATAIALFERWTRTSPEQRR
ncbi:hypothetical protein [Cognatilysobacter tabacisoli]|uniref:hypothetical protein n=1 Tax=Cognatilysobacter tabacisoli TaxID=2315424 RepID=UPI000E6B1832|nr:hypothetical protein [Lysobacter tabacisoli]